MTLSSLILPRDLQGSLPYAVHNLSLSMKFSKRKTLQTSHVFIYLYLFLHSSRELIFSRVTLLVVGNAESRQSRYSDWLRAGVSGDRISVGARFPAPVQTGPEAHPASCTMSTGSFPGVKSGRGVMLNPHPFLRRGQERVELYLYSP